MPTRERLDGFVAAVAAGDFVAAMRDYYHDDAVTRENSGSERRGLTTLIAIEEQALAMFAIRALPGPDVLLDGDTVAIRWTFELTDPHGVTRRMEEVALQHWQGDRIAAERFFYDPALPVVDPATA